ncbi:hypothetical protein EYF80_050182 [Liparis tanakae]|uniref:Uncharacterized protein n=1 Tax=Liparis tanakae TaxID=230148 RepID=A0A4Z2FFD4_9TELE|nr:hypothetical protein EYF80_050182 [Liparis tanakae]
MKHRSHVRDSAADGCGLAPGSVSVCPDLSASCQGEVSKTGLDTSAVRIRAGTADEGQKNAMRKVRKGLRGEDEANETSRCERDTPKTMYRRFVRDEGALAQEGRVTQLSKDRGVFKATGADNAEKGAQSANSRLVCLSVCLSVRPPPERKPHLPAPSSRPPLSSAPRLSAALRSVPVATLGAGASCVTTKCRLSALDGGMAPRFDR